MRPTRLPYRVLYALLFALLIFIIVLLLPGGLRGRREAPGPAFLVRAQGIYMDGRMYNSTYPLTPPRSEWCL